MATPDQISARANNVKDSIKGGRRPGASGGTTLAGGRNLNSPPKAPGAPAGPMGPQVDPGGVIQGTRDPNAGGLRLGGPITAVQPRPPMPMPPVGMANPPQMAAPGGPPPGWGGPQPGGAPQMGGMPAPGGPSNPLALFQYAQANMPPWAQAQGISPMAYASFLQNNPNSPGMQHFQSLQGGAPPGTPPPGAPQSPPPGPTPGGPSPPQAVGFGGGGPVQNSFGPNPNITQQTPPILGNMMTKPMPTFGAPGGFQPSPSQPMTNTSMPQNQRPF